MAGRYFPYGCHGNYDEDEALLRERGAYVTCAYRSCGLTCKTLETLERHVRLQHNLTWDAYTRYISGNSEEGEEEDETNSKKRDAYCVCTYLECGRKFKMLKSLEEHVTLYHNISWQNYTMYYHRLGKDGSDTAEDNNNTGASGPKIAPAHTEKVTKITEDHYKAPQKLVTQPTTRGPVNKSHKTPSCVKERNKPSQFSPVEQQQPDTALNASEMYSYMNVAPIQYYQDYSLLAPYIGAVPAVMADPMLWGYIPPTPEMIPPEQNPLNLAKPSQGQRPRSNQRTCDISRSSDVSRSDVSRSKGTFESNNNQTVFNLQKSVAQTSPLLSSGYNQTRFDKPAPVRDSYRTNSNRDYDICRNDVESHHYTSDLRTLTQNDPSNLSSDNVHVSSNYGRHVDHLSRCVEDRLFSEEALLPKKQDGVIIIEPRVYDDKSVRSYHHESAKNVQGSFAELCEVHEARDKYDRFTEACPSPIFSSKKHGNNKRSKIVLEDDIVSSTAQVCSFAPNSSSVHCGMSCGSLDSHVTKATTSASSDRDEQKRLNFHVTKNTDITRVFPVKAGQWLSRMKICAYAQYIKSRYKFWHHSRKQTSRGKLIRNIKQQTLDSRKARSYFDHKSDKEIALSQGWRLVVERYRTVVKSYKSRNIVHTRIHIAAKQQAGRIGKVRKMTWGSLGYLAKTNVTQKELEELSLAPTMKVENNCVSDRQPEMVLSSNTDIDMVKENQNDMVNKEHNVKHKPEDIMEDSSDSSSPLNIVNVDPFALDDTDQDVIEKLICRQCKQLSLTSSSFVRHLLSQHSLLRCRLCIQDCPGGGNIYRYEVTLKRHLEEFHEINFEDGKSILKYSKKASFAGEELKGLHSIEDTDQILAITNEKIYFSTGIAMSYKLCTCLSSGGKEDEPITSLEIFGVFICKVPEDGDVRTPPVSAAANSETAPTPPRPPDGSEKDKSSDEALLFRSASTDSGDAEEPKLIIAESESCDSHSSNSNSENVRYKGPKKRFLEAFKCTDSPKGDSASGPLKPKTSFNLRHCINQIIDSEAVLSRLLTKEDSPPVSRVSSPSVTAPPSLDNTPSHSPSPAASTRSEPVMNLSPAPSPVVRAGVKVRDIIQESVTASISNNSSQSDKRSNEKGGNPLLQMAALASMLPRQPVPSNGREGMPVINAPGQTAVPLAANQKPEHQLRTLSEAAPRHPGPEVFHHRQYVPPQANSHRYYAHEPVNLVPQQQQQLLPQRNAAPPPQLEQQPPLRNPGLNLSPHPGARGPPGPPPLIMSPSPKAVQKPRLAPTAAQGQPGSHVPINSKPQQHVQLYQNASPKQQPIAQSPQSAYPASHSAASVGLTTAAMPPKSDFSGNVIAPGTVPLVAGYVYSSQAPLDLSKRASVDDEPMVISDDQPLDLSKKPTHLASHSSGSTPRTQPYPQHSQGVAVVKAAQTWYPRDQAGNANNLSSRYSHPQGHRTHPNSGNTAMRNMDSNLARLQAVNRPFKPGEQSNRSVQMGISSAGNQMRPGYVRPMVAEVRPIVSQNKSPHPSHNSHARQMYHSDKGRAASPHAAGMHQGSYATPSQSPSNGRRTHSPSHSGLSHQNAYNSGRHSPGRSSMLSHSPGHQNIRTTSAGHSQGHMPGQGHSQGHMPGQGQIQGHAGHSVNPQGHPAQGHPAQGHHAMPSPQEQFLRQVTQHRDILVSREMLSPQEQQQMNLAPAGMRPRSSSTSSLLGNHPVDDILYLKCNICSSTYGSLHSFRKHFSKAHGFEPRPEHVTVRSISAAKEVNKAEAAQMADAKYQYPQQAGQPLSPSYQASPTGSNLSSPGVSGSMEHSSPGPRVSPSPHNRHQEIAKSDPAKLESTPPAGGSKSSRTVMRCFQCGQDFPTRDWGVFKRHMRAHEMPQLRCNICRQSFRDEQEFRDHNLTYHPVQNYPCRTCGVSFGHPAALSKHVKMVHAESPEPDAPNLQCLYCPHSFNSLIDFKTHIQEHERLLGISSKDSSFAQHSPQIRRASPDSTNDLEGQTCAEEKPIMPTTEAEGTTGAAKPRSKGIPIFNLNVQASNEKEDKSFRNMSIMDIVREKVEEASRKYLFDMCNKSEGKECAATNNGDVKGNKEIAIKQEVSMEVKQEIGDKIYVMNYQEKGTVKESHIDEALPAKEMVKETVAKSESDGVIERDEIKSDVADQRSNASLSSNNDIDKDIKDELQVYNEQSMVDKMPGSAIFVDSTPGAEFSKSADVVQGPASIDYMNREAVEINVTELMESDQGQAMESATIDILKIDNTSSDRLISQPVVPESDKQEPQLSLKPLSKTSELIPANEELPNNTEVANENSTTSQQVIPRESMNLSGASSSAKLSSVGTPAALMFDDTDTEDDDDGGSKLVICDDTDPDDSKDLDLLEKSKKSTSSDTKSVPATKRPLHHDADYSGGSPKRHKSKSGDISQSGESTNNMS